MSRSSRPKVIDVFAGVGGFSLGAVRAGFDVVAAIDLDTQAYETHQQNFPNSNHGRRDVKNLSGGQLRTIAGLNGHRLDGLIGGPPCQGFSTMGRMRKNDARNKLFYHFFRLVSEVKPLFFIAENVPGILDSKYDVLREESFRLVEREYQMLPAFEVSAATFGAATERTRVFFVGWAKDAGFELAEPSFATKEPTRKTDVRTAFDGLPDEIRPEWRDERYLWQQITKPTSQFGRTINRVAVGVGDETARKRFSDCAEVSGFLATKHTPEVVERFDKLEPGKMDRISKFPRLKWDGTCPTLRAGTASDRGSYQAARPIHPTHPRVITTREAARLQGFPDWFVFHPTRWHSFRQIGNSVSPLASEGMMAVLKKAVT
jgi:DNA (cytosine-5)-methyltransferase 1